MKKLIFLLAIGSSVALTSCQKEVIQPANPNPIVAQDINVEYRVYCESANVTLEILTPKQGQTNLETETVNINRNDYSFSFTTQNNTFLSMKAWNTNPGMKEITVEIYVNGNLFKSATLDHTTSTASVSGTFVE